MSENPYQLNPEPTPKELARTALVQEVLENLFDQHISLVAPRHYGKTVFVTALAAAARASKRFHDVVFWDLRHFTPADDSAFFARLAEILAEQVTCLGDDTKNHFSSAEQRTYTAIKGFFDHLQGLNMRILVIMDGMDQPLDCAGLTRGVWDNLSGFAKIGSVTLLATSRKPLRQLCKSATGRASDFWERFEDPPTKLKAFTPQEIAAFLKPLADAHGGLATGVDTEFLNTTGGIPRLAACLARRLYDDAKTPGSIPDVRRCAGWVLAEHTTALEAAWDVCSTEEQTAYADLLARGEIEAKDAGKLAHALVPLGLAETAGNKVRPTCALLRDFTSHLQSGLVSLKVLFGTPAAYEKNIRAVVEWRSRQVPVKDPELRDFLADAVERVGNPKLLFKEVRNIASHTLVRLWRHESPDGNSPRYESAADASKADPLRFDDDINLLWHLQMATNSKNRIALKKANRRIYALLSALQGYGDLGQHQGNQQLTNTYAACACLTLIELAAEMDKVGL
jgi:hypothetical protein